MAFLQPNVTQGEDNGNLRGKLINQSGLNRNIDGKIKRVFFPNGY